MAEKHVQQLSRDEKSSTDDDQQPSSQISASLDPRVERRLLRKIDLHLMIPLLVKQQWILGAQLIGDRWIIFILGFIDRINLGNVRVLGIVPDLRLTGNQFNIALQIFFVPYILVEIPSNIFLKKLTPSTWIASITFLWGLACMCQGFVRNNSGLIACRFFLGLFEGGFVPGSVYLMSMYFSLIIPSRP